MANCKVCGNSEISMNCICSNCINEIKIVIHGYWFDDKCSFCGYKNSNQTTFCPNCGAKMDGEIMKSKYTVRE